MIETATLGGGCFWCSQAIFERLKGVLEVTSGYGGGDKENPSYEDLHRGNSGHAEIIQIKFDQKIISYKTILEVFFKLHDPTTLNKQGADEGEQYRSIIFYHDQIQREVAEKVKQESKKLYKNKIVTEILPFKNFYKAEDEHQQFYEKNSNSMYCRLVIDPKITKLYREFSNITK